MFGIRNPPALFAVQNHHGPLPCTWSQNIVRVPLLLTPYISWLLSTWYSTTLVLNKRQGFEQRLSIEQKTTTITSNYGAIMLQLWSDMFKKYYLTVLSLNFGIFNLST
jgi:hypothetical protein